MPRGLQRCTGLPCWRLCCSVQPAVPGFISRAGRLCTFSTYPVVTASFVYNEAPCPPDSEGRALKYTFAMTQIKKAEAANGNVVTLKAVAAHVGLSAGTVSAVLNDAPSAKHIPKQTRDRIIAAARKLDYRPNYFARSLRKRRTMTIGVIAHEIGDGYSSSIIAGIENGARQRDYFFVTGVHRHDRDLFERYSRLLIQRGAEGIITVDFNLAHSLPLPAVAIPGHVDNEGVTNIALDHRHAAELALKHLTDLGHS